ncbi:hypothetical protein SAMN04488542_10573 [Fontibacillus panacisegetis]|uniref:Uncharacterized protein n=1 Tax=Fontibacillus panacisegetis TaxID=670482 RepID=A0A1G7HXN2_9BACL|nr:hypothetical protein [Fontibacillus panacisegetis]SDF05155.1 hypothetical protein SAMN04488542_10573 [Fontibacillus panacisegetis]
MNQNDVFDSLMYFKPFLKYNLVQDHLRIMGKYPDFKNDYSKNRQDNENIDVVENICMTLAAGLETTKLNGKDLDELLFLLIEDRLFDSFLYKLDATSIVPNDPGSIKNALKKWGAPEQNVILEGLAQKATVENFVIVGYRINESDSFRILLLDKNLITIKEKNKDPEYVVYATLIEFDFKRDLIHIRIKDVDKIESSATEVRTQEGRIERTLKFIDSLKPTVSYKKISNFRTSLFNLEEHVLQPKRDTARSKLVHFQPHINDFSNLIDSKFPTEHENDVTTSDYISNTVLAIISSSLNLEQLGDVVGIKFRNQRTEDNSSFAEVSISDKGFKCISTDKLYWSNLATLLEQRKIEFLKIGTVIPSGFIDANLELKIDTAHIRLNLSSRGKPDDGKKRPSDEKYNDFVDYLLPFIQ